LALRGNSFAASDVGKHRSSNQDAGYAGYQLSFVADGMGGHAGGDIASAISSQRIALVDSKHDSETEAIAALRRGLIEANAMLAETVAEHPELRGMGTTFSGLLVTEDKVVTAHIGDSRIYLVRDGQVRQVTADHTFVQRLVEMGKISPEEALIHPRRSVLMRVLGDAAPTLEIDFATYELRAGDRWLLCSDGLSGVVPEDVMSRILTSDVDPAEAVELLVGEALEFGAPDNVTVVITDIQQEAKAASIKPLFVGSAAKEVVIEERTGNRLLRLLSPRNLVELFTPAEDQTSYAPESKELLEKILRDTKRKLRWRTVRVILSWILLAGAILGVGYGAYAYTQTRFFVAEYEGQVTIFRGIREELGPLKFSQPYFQSDITVDQLPELERRSVEESIPAENLEDAERILELLSERLSE
jgi:serine/threonine protein phosphatase PrpC